MEYDICQYCYQIGSPLSLFITWAQQRITLGNISVDTYYAKFAQFPEASSNRTNPFQIERTTIDKTRKISS